MTSDDLAANDGGAMRPRTTFAVYALGAGDGFGAAIVHGILSNWTPEESAGFANAAGALVASQLLCSEAMPTEAEVREFLKASK